MKEETNKNLKNLIDLTLPFGSAISVKGLPSFHNDEIEYGTEWDKRLTSTITFNLHTVTHYDLPWVFTNNFWEKFMEIEPELVKDIINITSEKRAEIYSFFTENKIYDCLILDFRHKKHFIEQAMKKNWYEEEITRALVDIDHSFRLPEFLDSGISLENLKNLLRSLSITEGELKNILERERISNSILIFYTGWRSFEPQFKNISHPVFTGWHPFTMTPFLTKNALKYLINKDIAGIGFDSISLDNILYEFDESFFETSISIPIIEKLRYLSKQDEFKEKSLNIWKSRLVLPIFLSNKKYYIKNLNMNNQIFNQENIYNIYAHKSSKPKIYKKGRVYILPIKTSEEIRDAVIAKILFEEV